MLNPLNQHRQRIRRSLMMNEQAALARFTPFSPSEMVRAALSQRAELLIEQIRTEHKPSLMESMLVEYGLSTDEGVALMCLAEAMLRVPDAATVGELIEDKIAGANWAGHRGQSPSSLINASTWGLMLTGKILSAEQSRGVWGTLHQLVKRLSEPVVRTAVAEMLKKLGTQFVLGENIQDALKTARAEEARGYTYSYDMLGEGAKTETDALRYFEAYRNTILALTPHCSHAKVADNPGISVKLSALYPRYEFAKYADVMSVLVARTRDLARLAAQANMGFNIDAEEAERLDISLDVIEAVLRDTELANWQGFGVVVQAYGKRAPEVLDWLYELSTQLNRRIMVRLVKGAYWDAEIKRAQVLGLADFPVYTHKTHTDVAYLSCAQKLLAMHERIYPQFATHNAHTLTAILHFVAQAERPIAFEFQRLHGMGEALHDVVMQQHSGRCRIYAPVGAHRDLLAYLVRRLLENGANGSFVHQMADDAIPAARVAADPWAMMNATGATSVASPKDLFAPQRINSQGWDLTDATTIEAIERVRAMVDADAYCVTPFDAVIHNPANLSERVGTVQTASKNDVDAAIARAVAAQPAWAAVAVDERAACLMRLADVYEQHAYRLFDLLTREAGKTLADAVAEVREAVDFCRYYATQVQHFKDAPARGVVTCISPWNFPMAIFTGQIVAALVTGNAVLAKPAEQTPLIARELVALMHDVGIPVDIVQLLCGDGAMVGAALTADARINGVVFTGSHATAKLIQRSMTQHLSPDAMLIAETGGLNAMIVDSSALPEQVVRDVMASSFQSAGQRCSALRILYVQEDIADNLIEMICGAMQLLTVGNQCELSTDVGPVIDVDAQNELNAYVQSGDVIQSIAVPTTGYFVAPTLLRVSGIEAMAKEMFGPILHVATFKAHDLSQVVQDINDKGYGLTLGIHSRIEARVNAVCADAHIGNIYVNRNQIGAIVGSQPFGGHGLSGTGPKAGGALYLSRMVRGASSDAVMDAVKAERMARITAALPAQLVQTWQKVLHATAALNFSMQNLPSPTGERNEYRMIARGTVACLGGVNEFDLAAQVLAAVLCGNCVQLLEKPEWMDALNQALNDMFNSNTVISVVDAIDVRRVDALALFHQPDAQRAWLHQLAAYDGMIVPLMAHLEDVAILVHEQHICTDTTAAGGNAELLVYGGSK